MIRTAAIFLFVCLFLPLHLLALIGDWKTYTSKRSIRDISYSQGAIWLATSGGAVSYRLIDSSYQDFTTSEGLRSISLTSVAISDNGSIFFGSSRGILHQYFPETGRWSYDYSLNQAQSVNNAINHLQI